MVDNRGGLEEEMTPERWRRIGELVEAALGIDPAGREAWLLAACGDDDELRTEVGRLLAERERAHESAILAPPPATGPPPDQTANGPSHAEAPSQPPEPAAGSGDAPANEAAGLAQGPAIASQKEQQTISELSDAVRARLCELPIVYILILAASTLWSRGVLGRLDATITLVDGTIILALVGLVALLRSRRPIPLTWLQALEVGAVGLLAGRAAFVEYRLMLRFSLRGDMMTAPMTLKNVVLLTAVLILTYGLYVPKTWRRAALVTGPLALLPFATLSILALQHPAAMAWLGEGWLDSQTPRALLFGFDALVLAILAVGSAYGARTIFQLRRQVADARQFGQYRLKRRIGAGGMAEVYLAEHQLLKRPCAVKLIRPGVVTDPRDMQRFEREVRLTAKLSHPNTVEIYDYGRTEDGTYYYVMEYLKGLSLDELVYRNGALPPGRVVYLLRQVCGALREAHAAGLVHRDIKPSNIFAARPGGLGDFAKLLDFGLVLPAEILGEATLTGERQILGTPHYMSPEQAKGSHKPNERSDIYSLGAVAYYLLTGRPPFDANERIAVLIAHARDPVEPPSRVRRGIPQDLERVVLRCLAKPPEQRFPDTLALEQALGACACAADWDQARATQWWQDEFGDSR
jgi:tRNA A-37 threonylcarbamoyl transferase component Bud32